MATSQPPQALVDTAREIFLEVDRLYPNECCIAYDATLYWKATIYLHGKGAIGIRIPAMPEGITCFMNADKIVLSVNPKALSSVN